MISKIILVTPMSDSSVEQSDQCAAPESPHSKNKFYYRQPKSEHTCGYTLFWLESEILTDEKAEKWR